MIGAVVGFFSPAGYALPRQHLQATLRWLVGSGVPVALAQAVRPGQRPEPAPAGVASGVWYTGDTLFLKENLWNLGATLLPPVDGVAFFDADVSLSSPDWPAVVARSLERHDVIQPYEAATWLDRDGTPAMQRPAAAVAIAAGREPRLGGYHPGFAWAMTAAAFRAVGGFYELCPQGGGDCALAFALADDAAGDAMARRPTVESEYWHRESYRRWRRRVRAARLRVGYCAGVGLTHRWHGDRSRRLYVGRSAYMPQVGTGEYPLERRPDGLLQWTDAAANHRAQQYFAQRCEDG